MNQRPLGKTGILVSELALGTVELGMDYGFRDSSNYTRPEAEQAVRIIQRALDLGINLLDTARAYGESEALIGRALKDLSARPYVASKAAFPADSCGARGLRQDFFDSLHASLAALQLETIDLLQIHNPTAMVLECEDALDCLARARREGKIRFAGASVYGVPLALQVLDTPGLDVLQVPFNLLDQKMAHRVFALAAQNGVGVLTRSAFLRGVLTGQLSSVPERLAPLRSAAHRALEIAGESPERVAKLALRFCLSFPAISSVIIGVRSPAELESNVAAAAADPLPAELLSRLAEVSIADESLVDPNNWTGLI